MASTSWTPFGVALTITANRTTVTRTSATQFTVKMSVSWSCGSGNKTDYGMTATSGGSTVTLNTQGTKANSGSGTITGTYSISGNGAATKTVTVTFRNFNEWHDDSATKNINLSVSVPAWTSYVITYNANGGTGAPGNQTKWKNITLPLSSSKPTRSGYGFSKWNTKSDGTGTNYNPGGDYTTNASATLYAQWTANTYAVKYNANGGGGAPSQQNKTHGVTLTLSSTKPTRSGYTFKGWGTSASATTVSYQAGGSYTNNAAITLYAIWELAYKKPKITNVTIRRAVKNGEGDFSAADDGTYIASTLTWACDGTNPTLELGRKLTTETEWTMSAPMSIAASGTDTWYFGSGLVESEKSYDFKIVITDSGGSSTKTAIIPSQSFTIDCKAGGNGIAFGKTSELEDVADFKFEILSRENLTFTNGKNILGAHTNGNTYSALIPVTAAGNTSLGHGLYNAGLGNTHIYGNKIQFYTNDGIFTNGNDITMNNKTYIYGVDTAGNIKNAFQAQNENNNTIVGYGNYDEKSGNTNIYGHDVIFGVSNIATPGTFRPYRRQGDSFTITIRTAGYVTNSGKDVTFVVPFSAPIVGSPTVTVASGSGFTLRQGSKYTHGSSATSTTKPSSYSQVDRYMWHGIIITATFSDTTNVTNNDSIGIYWNGTITFS